MGGTFDVFNGHCDRKNGLHIHFVRQHNVCLGDSDGASTLTETETLLGNRPLEFREGVINFQFLGFFFRKNYKKNLHFTTI